MYAFGECDFDWSAPGGSSALLIDLIAGVFRVDEELALHLPENENEWPALLPKRRPSLAWLGVSLRIARLAIADPNSNQDHTLSIVAAGARLLALQSEIRAQALEQWSRMDHETREKLRRRPPLLGSVWSLDENALLHRRQATGNIVCVEGIDANVQYLFDALVSATARGSTNCFGSLEGITPLGWLVILATLTATFKESGTSGPGVKHAEMLPDIHQRLADVVKLLSISGDRGGEAPWGALSLIENRLSVDEANAAFSVLNEIDVAMGVEVLLRQSSFFSLKPQRRRGTVQFASERGSFELPAWQIGYAEIPGGRGTTIEHRLDQSEMVFSFVETRLDGRLLGVSIVQRQLSGLGNLASLPILVSQFSPGLENELVLPETPPRNLQIIEDTSVEIVSPATESVFAPPLPDTDVLLPEGSPTPPNWPVYNEIPFLRDELTASTIPGKDESIANLKRLQSKDWEIRGHKPGRHARVAFFQWDVDDSYRHPLFDTCQNGHEGALDLKHPQYWKQSATLESCVEHRRRELLKEALRACNLFDVDILLLPEYSIRPDTAAWLCEELGSRAPQTSVWAGTYRVPPQSSIFVGGNPPPEAWSAILPILLKSKDSSVEVRLRQKKYPSVAAGEVFRPGLQTLRPTFQSDVNRFDPRNYATELICSEVFLVTSPANLPAMTHAFRRLLIDFGVADISLNRRALKEHIFSDCISFGDNSSLSEAEGQPRLLLLVPAMTTRSVDYAVLGQANFLASAITTIFCNAVSKESRGESCIIGHDGWGYEGRPQPGIPGQGPYHGVLPGIYNPTNSIFNLGRLGRNEQALVIADIDPVYSVEGKPRPQMLLPPLSLVAHLPIIECRNPNSDSVKLKSCCQQHQTISPAEVEEVGNKIFNRLKKGVDLGWRTTAQDDAPEILGGLLDELATLADKSSREHKSPPGQSWLRERRSSYLREYLTGPRAWPPPVALDWLWVDVTKPPSGFPKIDVPPYSLAPNEKPASS